MTVNTEGTNERDIGGNPGTGYFLSELLPSCSFIGNHRYTNYCTCLHCVRSLSSHSGTAGNKSQRGTLQHAFSRHIGKDEIFIGFMNVQIFTKSLQMHKASPCRFFSSFHLLPETSACGHRQHSGSPPRKSRDQVQHTSGRNGDEIRC